MKLIIGFLAFVWLLCGLAGAWMEDELDMDDWKAIARGPITLVAAINDHPATYPDGG